MNASHFSLHQISKYSVSIVVEAGHLGAIRVSGVKSDQDAQIVKASIIALIS